MDHLEEAKALMPEAIEYWAGGHERTARFKQQQAIAHALIAIAEKLDIIRIHLGGVAHSHQ